MITKNIQIFALALVGSVSLGWGMNIFSSNLADFNFAHQLRVNPEILAAYAAQDQIEYELLQEKPFRTKNYKALAIQGTAAISLFLDEETGLTKVLFEKNPDTTLLIASLTKLITALTALEHYPPNLPVHLTQDILDTEGEAGQLQIDDAFTVKDLLYMLLIESSNDAAAALSIPKGMDEFVNLMNQEAKMLKLQKTSFVNPTGLDTPNSGNYSTAADLSQIAVHIVQNEPQIFDILSLQQIDLYDQNGAFHHKMENTNQLLKYHEWPTRILGGKTGWTPRAGSSLVLVLESPDQNGYVISVLLASEDRFGEMKEILDWVLHAYQWN